MFAQAISRTTAVITNSMVRGVFASRCIEVWPRAPDSRTTRFALNLAIVWSLMPCWRGASTSARIGATTRSSASFVASTDTPGLRLPKT